MVVFNYPLSKKPFYRQSQGFRFRDLFPWGKKNCCLGQICNMSKQRTAALIYMKQGLPLHCRYPYPVRSLEHISLNRTQSDFNGFCRGVFLYVAQHCMENSPATISGSKCDLRYLSSHLHSDIISQVQELCYLPPFVNLRFYRLVFQIWASKTWSSTRVFLISFAAQIELGSKMMKAAIIACINLFQTSTLQVYQGCNFQN